MRDRDDKGRTSQGDRHWTREHPELVLRGEKHGRAKISAEDVREIRELAQTLPRTVIAQRFGISDVHVGYIVLRKSWRHVDAA
jgi:hypothetical protein